MNAVGVVVNEMVVEELVGLVARKIPYTKVIGAVECALRYFDAFRVVGVFDFVVVEYVRTV